MVFNGTTAGVVMATPSDLADLGIGFSLTEGIVQSPAEIQDLDIVPGRDGIELRMWLTPHSDRQFQNRQRRFAGPTGCGLCGIESLSEATRPLPKVSRAITLAAAQIEEAVDALASAQILNSTTHATHAAGFFSPDSGLVMAREDVGRHNALDKLAGALATQGISGATGAIILTSRVSVEMVQKAALIGSCVLVAISAPTALAVRTADTCAITLVGIARGSAFEIFSYPEGILCE